MDNAKPSFRVQMDLLADTLQKKIELLSQILVITENQESILLFPEPSEELREMLRGTTAEKQRLIDEVLHSDAFFSSVFDQMGQEFEEKAPLYKEETTLLQEGIRRAMDLDIKIRLQEQKNRQLAGQTPKQEKHLPIGTDESAKKRLLEQYRAMKKE